MPPLPYLPRYNNIKINRPCKICPNDKWCKQSWLFVLKVTKDYVYVARYLPCKLNFRNNRGKCIVIGICSPPPKCIRGDKKCHIEKCRDERMTLVVELFPKLKSLLTKQILTQISQRGGQQE